MHTNHWNKLIVSPDGTCWGEKYATHGVRWDYVGCYNAAPIESLEIHGLSLLDGNYAARVDAIGALYA